MVRQGGHTHVPALTFVVERVYSEVIETPSRRRNGNV